MTDDNDPINNRDNFKAGVFYYNPDDDRLLVRVPGTVNRYVFNYARWPVYLIVVPVRWHSAKPSLRGTKQSLHMLINGPCV